MTDDVQSKAAEAAAALEKVRTDWLKRSGVTGIDVGLLWKDGRLTEDVGIRVKVEKLLAPEDVPEGELFPRHHEGHRVQVLEEAAPEPQPAAAEPAAVEPIEE